MPDRPHLAFPLRFTAAGGFAMVEQGSVEHTQQRAAVVLSTVEGDLPYLPTLGIPEQAFSREGEFNAEMRAAVDTWVPSGAGTLTDDMIDRARSIAATVRSDA